jgi:hypothetical protein
MTYEPVCREYLDDIGELPGGGEFAPPFLGGQCEFGYNVTGSLVLKEIASGETLPASPITNTAAGYSSIPGPVSGAYKTSDGGGITAAGTTFPYFVNNPAVFQIVSWQIVSVTPNFSGNIDDCGDPEDGYEPRDYLPDDGGGREPISPPGVPPFSIDIGPDGDINIDFPGFDGPGRSIEDPFLPPSPEDYGPQPAPPPVPGDRGEPDAPTDVGPGSEVSGEDSGRVLVGIKVTLTDIPPRARVSFLGGDPYYSYAYSVLMGGDGGVERDNDSAFAPGVAFYHAPENSNRYSVAFRNGFGGSVVAYWKEVSED